jgi:hypothetical protein
MIRAGTFRMRQWTYAYSHNQAPVVCLLHMYVYYAYQDPSDASYTGTFQDL